MFAKFLVRPVGSRLLCPSYSPLCRRYASTQSYEHLLISNPKPGVALSTKIESCSLAVYHAIIAIADLAWSVVTLNRPRALNAMNSAFMSEINSALQSSEKDPSIGATVITGSEKAFVAGADIKEMKDKSFAEAYSDDFIESWSTQTAQIKKPIISAVNGYALGGGCELAMMADILYCSASATFGQPEIKLGIIPGAGGSQRLTRAIGKSRAMELVLTGKNFTAKEAFDWGLAARVFDTPQECVDGAIVTAATISGYSRIAVKACKEVVNKSQDLGIRDGVEFERRVFHGLFGSRDQKIGV